MGLRKGQFIVNHLRGMKVHEGDIGRRLFAMRDEEFEEIEHAYRMYAISRIHDPKQWDRDLKFIDKMLDRPTKSRKKGRSTKIRSLPNRANN